VPISKTEFVFHAPKVTISKLTANALLFLLFAKLMIKSTEIVSAVLQDFHFLELYVFNRMIQTEIPTVKPSPMTFVQHALLDFSLTIRVPALWPTHSVRLGMLLTETVLHAILDMPLVELHALLISTTRILMSTVHNIQEKFALNAPPELS
jgi:hypothetical protein